MIIKPSVFAKNILEEVDFDDYSVKKYSKAEISRGNLSFTGVDNCHTFEVKELSSGEKFLSYGCALSSGATGGIGGSASFTLPDAVKHGTVMMDISVKNGSGTQARNLFLLKSSSAQKVFTMSLSPLGTLYGATQGSFSNDKGFTGEEYITDNDGFYNLRMVLSRNDMNLPWSFRVYDILTSLDNPIYNIEIPEASLADIEKISAYDVWNTKTMDAYIHVKEISLFTPTTEDLLINAEIIDEDGEKAYEFKGKDKLYANLDITNITSEDTSVTAYLGIYYNDILSKMVVYSIPIEADEVIESQKLELDFSEVTAYNLVEFMLWETDRNIPLIDKKTIVYKDGALTEYTAKDKKTNIITIKPNKKILAMDVVSSNFTLMQNSEVLNIDEVRLEPLINEITFYLKEELSLADKVEIKSAELKCLDGETLIINDDNYPIIKEKNELYGFDFHGMRVLDSKNKPMLKIQENGEYTVEIEFVNNSGTVKNKHIALYEKSAVKVKKLDEYDIEMKNYSKNVYSKKYNLSKNSIVYLIIEN